MRGGIEISLSLAMVERAAFCRQGQRFAGTTSRLAVSLEAFNLLNGDAITSRTTRSGPSYFTPTGLVPTRQLRAGLSYRF